MSNNHPFRAHPLNCKYNYIEKLWDELIVIWKIDTKFSVNTSVNTHKTKLICEFQTLITFNRIQWKSYINRQKHLIFKKVDNFDGKDYLRKSFENKITLKLNHFSCLFIYHWTRQVWFKYQVLFILGILGEVDFYFHKSVAYGNLKLSAILSNHLALKLDCDFWLDLELFPHSSQIKASISNW